MKKEIRLTWAAMPYGYRAEHEGVVYFIQQSSNIQKYNRICYNLSCRDSGANESHILGGVPIYKLKSHAEKDLRIRFLKKQGKFYVCDCGWKGTHEGLKYVNDYGEGWAVSQYECRNCGDVIINNFQ